MHANRLTSVQSWRRWLVPALATLLLAGCATTKLTSTWRSPDFSGPPMKKVAVFVLDKDENMRRFAEDQMSRALPAGTQALPSHRLFDKPEKDIDRIKGRLSREGYDAVLMARTVSYDKTREYVPPFTYQVPTGPMLVGPLVNARTLDIYYTQVWGMTYQTAPGYVADVVRIVVETVMYRLPDGAAVWSAVSETENPGSKAAMVQELVGLVRGRLVEDGMVSAR